MGLGVAVWLRGYRAGKIGFHAAFFMGRA
jgi:hypothetical protein